VICAGWMRPQNDGCALRSVTLINYANQLIAAGQKDYVAANLWNSDPSQPGINHDLDYVLSNWNLDSGDPWEEVRGQVFFEKFAARKALTLGAALATQFGDTARAATFSVRTGLSCCALPSVTLFL
jgi:glucoamylase